MMDPEDYQSENSFHYNEDDQDSSVSEISEDLDDLGEEPGKFQGEETTQMPDDESVLFDRLKD